VTSFVVTPMFSCDFACSTNAAACSFCRSLTNVARLLVTCLQAAQQTFMQYRTSVSIRSAGLHIWHGAGG
jgi:hypothetical protein